MTVKRKRRPIYNVLIMMRLILKIEAYMQESKVYTVKSLLKKDITPRTLFRSLEYKEQLKSGVSSFFKSRTFQLR